MSMGALMSIWMDRKTAFLVCRFECMYGGGFDFIVNDLSDPDFIATIDYCWLPRKEFLEKFEYLGEL